MKSIGSDAVQIGFMKD